MRQRCCVIADSLTRCCPALHPMLGTIPNGAGPMVEFVLFSRFLHYRIIDIKEWYRSQSECSAAIPVNFGMQTALKLNRFADSTNRQPFSILSVIQKGNMKALLRHSQQTSRRARNIPEAKKKYTRILTN